MLATMFLANCQNRQQSDQEWVDSVLATLDTVPDDTARVMLVEEEIRADVLDANFEDFLFNFIRHESLRASRTALPLALTNSQGDTLQMIENTQEIADLIAWENGDYVMLIDDVSSLEEQNPSLTFGADLHCVDMDAAQVHRFYFAHQDRNWHLETVQRLGFEEHPQGSFLSFFRLFVSDKDYQLAHIAQPLEVVLPAEEAEVGEEDERTDEENNPYAAEPSITGTIDANQYPAFAPELPHHRFAILEHADHTPTADRIVMVFCNLSGGMADLLTFEHNNKEWKLVKMER